MYRNHTVAVVVPAYNEEILIARVIETMPDYVDRIVVVDDCSRDGTVETVCRYLPQLGERGVDGVIAASGRIGSLSKRASLARILGPRHRLRHGKRIS